ncbi:MAG: OmpA family protein [Pseudomonadota bacterium]
MAISARLAATVAVSVLGMAACAPQVTDTTAPAVETAVECIPMEDGALYTVVDGKLTAAQPPEPVIIERVVEPELAWYERVEATFPNVGFPWLNLDARNVESGVVTLTGLAPSAEAKERALSAGEDAIKATAPGRDLLIVDGISVEGGEEAVGAALATLDNRASVSECQDAFTRVMDNRNVSFSTGGAGINDESARLLDAASGVAKLCQSYEIEIGGHTDKVGDALFNQRLSERRAQSVRQFLVERGVPASILVAIGYGESDPIDTRDNEEAYAANRRTEFIVRERR